jgi:hypothetical protein
MRKGLVLAVCAVASLGGGTGAQAETVQVPNVYAIPLPPVLEPRFEVGMRYWQSVGKTRFSINSSKADPTAGNPTSVLTYDDMDGYSGEFFWYARNETNTFAKGFIGGGGLTGGSLDDEDYFAGQIKFSDTFSKLKGESLIYGTIDVGQNFTLIDGPSRLSLSPFIGYNYWQETATGYGARCNHDDIDGAVCGAPGEVVVPFSTEVIKNKAMWSALRLGGEVKAKLWNRLTLTGEAAILPVTYVVNEDSHFLRADLGRPPNIEDRGIGWGYQLEAALRYDITPGWSAGAGVRYWYAEVDGKSDFVHFDVKVPLKDFTSERFGVFSDVSYRF